MSSAASWEFFDVASIGSPGGFQGAVETGLDMYFVPYVTGPLVRYHYGP
jgi:hypothetical protein